MRTSMQRIGAAGALALVAAVAGCKDLVNKVQDKINLSTALANAATGLGNQAAAYGAYGVLMVTPGTLGAAPAPMARDINADITGVDVATYQGAIGLQVLYTSGSTHGTFTGVIGWDGFNSTNKTVDEVVVAGLPTATSSPQTTGGFPINDTLGVGSYWTRVPAGSFVADSGLFTLSSASFAGGGTDCTSLLASAGVTVTSCSYQTGTMSGSFHFGSAGLSGGSPATYVQTPVAFTSLPSVQITIVK